MRSGPNDALSVWAKRVARGVSQHCQNHYISTDRDQRHDDKKTLADPDSARYPEDISSTLTMEKVARFLQETSGRDGNIGQRDAFKTYAHQDLK